MMENDSSARSHDSITVVTPVFNESENLTEFCRRMQAVMDESGLSWSLMFVDDGSSDDSVARIEEIMSQDNRIGLIQLSRNFGKEVAMTA